MKKIAIFLLMIVLLVSCKNSGKTTPVLKRPTADSLAAAILASESWSRNNKSAADLSEGELVVALAALDNVNVSLDGAADPTRLIQKAALEVGNERGWTKDQSQAWISTIKPDELWRTKNNVYGFIEAGSASKQIQPAFSIEADKSLMGAHLKITLDRFKVKKYPGRGTHNVALSFHGQTQNIDQVTPLTFCLGVTAREEDEVGVVGKSIFVGLNAGTEGIDFKGSTVNVNTEKDKTFFSILSGQLFSHGLKLIDTVQPALTPLTELANGVSKELSEKNKGVPVDSFDLGLDFSDVESRIKLREGSYIIIQIPPADAERWNWNEWEFDNGRIQNKSNRGVVPYNYLVIGISKMNS